MISSDNLFFFLWTCLPLFSILWVSFLLQSVETKITMYGFLIYVFFCIVERLSTVSIQQIHLFAMVFLSLCKKLGYFLSPAWSTDYLWWPATLALTAPHTSQLLFCINFLLAYVSIYHALPTGLLWRCECSVHFSDLPQLQRNSFARCISIRFSI